LEFLKNNEITSADRKDYSKINFFNRDMVEKKSIAKWRVFNTI
jgi:hypothetical protein